jgi:hypothetical protein
MLLNYKFTAQCAPSSTLRQAQYVRPITRALNSSSSASISCARLQGRRQLAGLVVPTAAAVSGVWDAAGSSNRAISVHKRVVLLGYCPFVSAGFVHSSCNHVSMLAKQHNKGMSSVHTQFQALLFD